MDARETAARWGGETIIAQAVEEPPTLAERVEHLEAIVREFAEAIENNRSAMGRVGTRLSRAEKYVGLPSTDA
jgi:hypothetical protein